MGILKVQTNYAEENIIVEYTESDNKVSAIVKDKYTHEVLTSYEQEIVEEQVIRYASDSKQPLRSYLTVHLTQSYNPVGKNSTKMTVLAVAKLYKEVIAGQVTYSIVGINSCDHYLNSSGTFTIESKYTSVQSHTLKSCKINVTGVLMTTKTMAGSAGITVEVLESWGFNIEGSLSGNWYARYPYNSTVTIYV